MILRRSILVLRLVLGAVFLYAAWTKLRASPLIFAMSVDSYQLLPEWGVLAVAYTLLVEWVSEDDSLSAARDERRAAGDASHEDPGGVASGPRDAIGLTS